MDLRCKCGMETTYGDAALNQKETECDYTTDGRHNFHEINDFDQIPGDAWRNTEDSELWATHELKCTECSFMFLVAYGAKQKGLNKFGGVVEDCPNCGIPTACIESEHKNAKAARNDAVERNKEDWEP